MSGEGLTCLYWVRDQLLPVCRCSPMERHILLYLASFADPDGSHIYQCDRSIAAGTGHDRRHVRDALEYWELEGALIKVRPGRPGRGHGPEWRIPVPQRRMIPVPQKGSLDTRLKEKRGPNGVQTGVLGPPTDTDTEERVSRSGFWSVSPPKRKREPSLSDRLDGKITQPAAEENA